MADRFCFHIYQHDANWHLWLLADLTADAIYLADTLLFRTRLMFLDKSVRCTQTQICPKFTPSFFFL